MLKTLIIWAKQLLLNGNEKFTLQRKVGLTFVLFQQFFIQNTGSLFKEAEEAIGKKIKQILIGKLCQDVDTPYFMLKIK